MTIKELDQTPSTNTWAKQHAAELTHGTVVVTHNQTAGRGQRGNCWEAAPGKNLTFSLFLHPEGVSPAGQFLISEIVALAVVEAVEHALAEAVASDRIKVKWPNDIYVDDRKIAGILIEHTLTGSGIGHTIAGIGLNVNQTVFESDAPNPVSLAMLAHKEFALAPLLAGICSRIAGAFPVADADAVHAEYHRRLWRADGKPHTFALPDGTRFEAIIEKVAPGGQLSLLTSPGAESRTFLFKEVAFVL